MYKAKQYIVDLRFASSNKKVNTTVGGRRQLSDVAPIENSLILASIERVQLIMSTLIAFKNNYICLQAK